MSSDEEGASRTMDKKIQAAVQAEVEAVLARMNPPASSATSTILPIPVPTTSAVSYPGKPLHFCYVPFSFLIILVLV